MDSTTQTESPWRAAGELLAHLQRCPTDVARPPRELAAQFGLDEGFVRTVVAGATVRPAERRSGPSALSRAWTGIAGAWGKASSRIGRWMDRPVLFANGVAVVWAVGCFLIGMVSAKGEVFDVKPEAGSFEISLKGYFYMGWTLLAFVLAMATLCRARMARYAVWHALFCGALWTGMVALSSVVGSKGNFGGAFARTMAASFGFGFLALLYGAFGALIAVLGGYVSLKVSDRDRNQLTRHELLGRYFELQTRLQKLASHPPPAKPSGLLERLKDRVFLYSFGTSFVLGLLTVGLSTATGIDPSMASKASSQTLPGFAVFMLGSLVLGTLSLISHLGYAFLSGSVVRSFGVSLLGTLGSVIAELIPIGNYGPQMLMQPSILFAVTIGAGVWCVLGAGAALGAMVQERAGRDRRLAQNDPATVLSEILQIQMRLSQGSTPVCVLVIDAAKSSEMKAKADALVAEFSFRAYQGWIERHCEAHQGTVHSTAGDGAVVAFSTCGQALAAANAMLDDLDRFNEAENWLERPFRVRIGLHVGIVVAELDKVEFTEVIDIAAHIEGAAPIGGIAVSEAVALEMAGTRFEPTGQVIDNQRVFLARKPS